MSWSVSFIGKPERVVEAIDAKSAEFQGQSKAEYDDAKEGLKTLVSQVVGQNVKVAASGHATFVDGKKTFGSCSVAIDPFYGEFLG